MSITSMTGFARESFEAGPWRIVWELKTVNGKGLDLRLRLPPSFDVLQEEARRILGDVLKRGTCFATMTALREGPSASVKVNTALLEAVVAALEPYDGRTGMRAASLDAVLGIRGVVEVVEAGDVLDEEISSAVLDGLRKTAAALRRTRAEEGRAIAGFLQSRLDAFVRLADAADACPARKPDAIRARLAEQIRALTEAGPGLDPQRLHQEAVLMAAKADIREEIDRIRAHVDAVRALLTEGGAIGRRRPGRPLPVRATRSTNCSRSTSTKASRTSPKR